MRGLFSGTRAFEREFENLFDFIGASAAAIWNMRWQVRGYKDAHPDASTTQLAGHFIVGSGLSSFKFEYFTDYEWQHQEEQIARTALVNVIALYERWLDTIPSLKMTTNRQGRLQRPPARKICEAIPSQSDAGFVRAAADFRLLIPNEAAEMQDLYGQSLQSLAIYEGSSLAELLVFYRFFKELRNQVMHRSELPDSLLLEAYMNVTKSNYTPKRSSTPGWTRVPAVTAGTPTRLTIKQAFFACHMIRSLVRTIDIEYSLTQEAMDEVVQQLTGSGPIRVQWAGSEGRTIARFRRIVNYEGNYPAPKGAQPSTPSFVKKEYCKSFSAGRIESTAPPDFDTTAAKILVMLAKQSLHDPRLDLGLSLRGSLPGSVRSSEVPALVQIDVLKTSDHAVASSGPRTAVVRNFEGRGRPSRFPRGRW